MKFDLIGIGILTICILIGNILGSMLGGTFGTFTGILGIIMANAIIYGIWALLTGQKMNGMTAIIFIIGMFIASYGAGQIASYLGYISGILLTIVEAVTLSFILSFIGPKQIQKELPASI